MSKKSIDILTDEDLSFDEFKESVLNDYKLACESREASLIGRKEVLTGKAKFGIFGDGKEVAQLAMAKAFKNGDFRSGYYRDQTFMFAIGQLTLEQWFAQLYADVDLNREPASGGRQMNGHFATRSLDENGNWINLTEQKNSSADVSPTGSQMPRLVGLAYASKLYRQIEELKDENFSINGDEVAFGTIGNASTAEGMFWESVNAAGVSKIPMAISIWDDEYGISVSNEYQVTKGDLSSILNGFKLDDKNGQGFNLYRVNGWDYPELVKTYKEAISKTRETHIPCIIHVVEMTQPQGHSTSGSHERYKSKERLQWEEENDCINKMRDWVVSNAIASEEELDEIEKAAKKRAKDAKTNAYKAYINPIKEEIKKVSALIGDLAEVSNQVDELKKIQKDLKTSLDVFHKTAHKSVYDALRVTRGEENEARKALINWRKESLAKADNWYHSHLYSQSERSAEKVEEVSAAPNDEEKKISGYEVLNKFFDAKLKENPKVFAFGEDLGKIGGVNQGMAGLQEKYGELRVSDTGIREVTIIGQGIGAAMRGLRPIAEIQYLDYVLYALQIMSDDLSTVQYRTKGGQKAPLIIRTRGHRFEGIWHAGSPMGGIINLCRGMVVAVPRNMTQAAGLYNALLKSDDPGIVIERLNAYRMKEVELNNLSEYTVPVGVPEILREGEDVTLVSYGASLGPAEEATEKLAKLGISVELIDVQTLLPFDKNQMIVESLKKTNRVVFMDEDVPGGASAFMYQQVIQNQKGYWHLDSEPVTIAASPHRPPYATDGDYFTKPNAEDVIKAIYGLMHEFNPDEFPLFDV